MQKVYILKPYSPYVRPAPEETIEYIFRLYGEQYCIASVVLDWGIARTARPIEEEDDFGYTFYETFDDAMAFVKQLKEFEK